ncbi:MAG: SDR family NAD(P)-dependent oxidoreductase [Alphaproteobacteria bacterium]
MTNNFKHLTSIKGQVAVVTGGTAGIGGACTERFAFEGATTIALGRVVAKGEKLIDRLRESGHEAHFLACDCANEDQVLEISKVIQERWGRADILCNIAGGWIEAPPIEGVTIEALNHSYSWNITSKFLMTKALVPLMKKNGYGRIVNMSSTTGRRGRVDAALQYSTMEAGVLGFTRALAMQLAPFGITVNAIAPGTTRTPRAERHSEERLAATARGIPVGRLGLAAEQAHAIWYLCTPGAAFTTGATLDVNGGNWTG